MKILVAAALMFTASSAIAQETLQVSPNVQLSETNTSVLLERPQKLPDYGYVVYDNQGKPVKAFGPGTPVTTDNGSVQIIGGKFPTDWTVKTEDTPTYWRALAAVTNEEPGPESDYTKKFRELVTSIDEGAGMIKDKLCQNPARPSNVKVEVVGGFSFGVYGSVTSTVDWDLDKICPSGPTTSAQ